MLSILGVGHAYGATPIDNKFLSELNGAFDPAWILKRSGISSRASVLSHGYLAESGNSNPLLAVQNSVETPTDLSIKAAQMAIERAGVTPEQIGLIIGDTATPLETTPSEAQRVGQRLGLKIPAYDFSGLCSVLPLHLEALSSWQAERTPQYILSLSSNSPTQFVNYRSGLEGAFFGDAAGAMVLSATQSGKLSVLDAFYQTEVENSQALTLETYGSTRVEFNSLEEFIRRRSQEVLAKLIPELQLGSCAVVGPEFEPNLFREIAKGYKLSEAQIWSSAERSGYALGATPYCTLSEKWSSMRSNQELLIITAGGGLSFGYAKLKVSGS